MATFALREVPIETFRRSISTIKGGTMGLCIVPFSLYTTSFSLLSLLSITVWYKFFPFKKLLRGSNKSKANYRQYIEALPIIRFRLSLRVTSESLLAEREGCKPSLLTPYIVAIYIPLRFNCSQIVATGEYFENTHSYCCEICALAFLGFKGTNK